MSFLLRAVAVSLVLSLFVSGPSAAFALTPPPEVYYPVAEEPAVQAVVGTELVSCFDYYRFGSTPIVFRGDISTVSQGGSIQFIGQITNENPYPIKEVGIYAKVQQRWTDEKTSFGPHIVDWFPVEEGITLKAGETKPIAFIWRVPKNAEPGSYKMALFVASHQRFNLQGLSFTNDIVGGFYNFKVVGDAVGTTRFDIDGLEVGGQVVHQTAFSPQVDTTGPVLITAALTNPTTKPVVGSVTWTTYVWDGLREETVLNRYTESITIEPKSVQQVVYRMTSTGKTVYYVLGEFNSADPDEAKSLVSIRFVSNVLSAPRINYLGVTENLSGGGELFACVHASGKKAAQNVRIEVSAVGERRFFGILPGLSLADAQYEGTVSGEIVALTKPILNTMQPFMVSARVYQDDQLIDEVRIPYECGDFQGPCSPPTPFPVSIFGLLSMVGLVLGGVVLIVLFRIRAKVTKGNENTTLR
ncbi:MAG: hypothetical protein NBV63_02245 [Candidatus Pacebacteria bacterium]|nr:hypothetical protein [Candidatus Paceibacterota bacterium]